VVTERSPLSRGERDATPRAALARAHFDALVAPHLGGAPTPALLDGLGALLALHADADPFDGTCVHLDEHGYGTRSSMVLVMGRGGRALRWREGKPCRGPLEDRSALLAELVGG
jgi:hypothetical protein